MTMDERDRKSEGGNGSGDRKPYRKSYGKGNGDRGHNGGGHGSYGGKGGYKPRDRDGSNRGYGGKKGFKPRDGDRPRESREGGYRPHDGDGSDFKPRDRDDGGRRPYGEKRDFKPRDGDRRSRDGVYRSNDRRDGGRGRDNRSGGRRPYGDRKEFKPRDGDRPRESREEAPQAVPEEPRFSVPSTPQRILFKGVDCEVNGKTDFAMALYLHGAVQMSGGCESNALRMLRDMGPSGFDDMRERLVKLCSQDAMTYYDFLCMNISKGYDRSALRAAAEDGDNLAIYCLIRLEEVEGEDELVDVFAKGVVENEDRVVEALKLLVRKKDSEK
ncbi:MAG: hypothetical protein IJ469_08570, partial [Candidatus Methanomethylophilaceae archaeon]|nr:hypothetical protein [Candidatus Methanomethylophilaceae archaeon]